jgi:hypothetical protein
MLCIRLGATIDCREAFERVRDSYAFGAEADEPAGAPQRASEPAGGGSAEHGAVV